MAFLFFPSYTLFVFTTTTSSYQATSTLSILIFIPQTRIIVTQITSSSKMELPPGDDIDQAISLPRKVYNANTGVDLTEFQYFRKLPPEMRNMVYKLVLISKRSIQISSPLGKRRRGAASNFASLLLANKATYEEARGIYYLYNTFAVGNNAWGISYLSNLHGLRAFMRVADRVYLAHINHIEINVCADKYLYVDPAMDKFQFYNFESDKGNELRSICLLLLEHFRGLKTITIKACQMYMRPRGSKMESELETHPRGDYETAGDALKLLLDGNQKGRKKIEALDVKRFQWYLAEKIVWDWDRSGQKLNRLNSFAGYVEGRRRDLRNGDGQWEPEIVKDD
ncbi:hypothetical protein DL98DRAFT_571228 [Cadophora sp. DSE1049]|nr:hypothetical protein DL98DRAFT_571228 [Cadophora sp. DSE1049]